MMFNLELFSCSRQHSERHNHKMAASPSRQRYLVIEDVGSGGFQCRALPRKAFVESCTLVGVLWIPVRVPGVAIRQIAHDSIAGSGRDRNTAKSERQCIENNDCKLL